MRVRLRGNTTKGGFSKFYIFKFEIFTDYIMKGRFPDKGTGQILKQANQKA